MKIVKFRFKDPSLRITLFTQTFHGYREFCVWLKTVGFPERECNEISLRKWLARDGDAPRWFNPLIYNIDVYESNAESLILKLTLGEE